MRTPRLITTIIALLMAIAGSKAQAITHEQASDDIDSLLYALTEIHPNLYSCVGMSSLNSRFEEFKNSIPDSISTTDLYRGLAPIVAQIGDAHTNMTLPFREIMLKAEKYIPVYPTLDNNTGRMYIKASVDNGIPYDSEILSINGISAADMVNKMKELVGGERDFYRLSMIDSNIMGVFHLLFPATQYTIKYRTPGSKRTNSVTLPAADSEQLNSRLVLSPKTLKLMEERGGGAPYTFRILDDAPIAIMNFDACQDVQGMETFADSMFSTLRDKGIKKLIIDMRYNGGGNSAVGDILLKYIAPKPYAQFGTTYVRVTPTTRALTGNRYAAPGIFFYPEDSTEYHTPLPASQRFEGKICLLISHLTFSSASSFAWAFKEFGCGTVIGEETGGMSVHYGDVVTYTLPHSHLTCGISHKRFWQPRANENDIHGVLPDIPCTNEEAMEKAIAF